MPTFADILRGAPREPALPLGFQSWEWQWCHTGKGGWAEGQAALQAAFPKATRKERPAPWYHTHLWTHAPGKTPPGNGPFYWPEWAGPTEGGAFENWTATLKTAGFKRRRVAVAILPSTREYLLHAVRVARGSMQWNVDPILYVVYGYPGGGSHMAETDLRPFNTGRWTPQGVRAS